MKLQDLPRTLIGGTLVEFKGNTGFGLEFGRATIVEMSLHDDMFSILTDNAKAFMEQNISPSIEQLGYVATVEQRGQIYLISSPMGWCYALAPKGVVIPPKPNWMDVSDAVFIDTLRRHADGEI